MSMRFLIATAVLVLLLTAASPSEMASVPFAGAGIQQIARAGDTVGGTRIKPDAGFFVGGLNDQGRITFAANSVPNGQLLLQYSGEVLSPLVVPGGDAPGGKWSKNTQIRSPVCQNEQGSIVFAADLLTGGKSAVGTFQWDAPSGPVRLLALDGMVAAQSLTFAVGGSQTAVLNNAGDVALVGKVRNMAGQPRDGVFFLGRDGRLQPVVVPDQELPDGGQVLSAWLPSLNDAGPVALDVQIRNVPADRLYLWEQGLLTALPPLTKEVTRGLHFTGFTGVWLNNKNRNVLMAGHFHTLAGAANALYLLADGKMLPVAAPGQEMPGGGRFLTLQPQDPADLDTSLASGVSAANEAGQHAVLALLQGGATAAYLMDADRVGQGPGGRIGSRPVAGDRAEQPGAGRFHGEDRRRAGNAGPDDRGGGKVAAGG